MPFADDFTWGVASASYQIEGAVNEDGRGDSVWDMFCRKPGAVWNGQSGAPACDHYHRYAEDAKLMGELGLRAYRFSIAWPRVLPKGIGTVNEAGLAFYDRLVDELLATGVEPWVTLFHWDYPLALYHRGGWLNPDSPDWFAEYASVVVDKLSDRVSHWMPINEPQVFVDLGHRSGIHAPGDRLAMREVLAATRNVLLAHGKAVQTIRARSTSAPTVGTAVVASVRMPANDSPEDVAAARAAMFDISSPDIFSNTLWMDPLFTGRCPDDAKVAFGDDMPEFSDADLKTIHQPVDLCGVNIYNGRTVRAGADGRPEDVPLPVGYPMTTQDGWPVTPSCLYWGPRLLHERYGLPIVITENGHQNADVVSLDGKVHDPQRIDYLQRYLRELRRATDEGVSVKGYFQWCFTDNFEWALGYAVRVGIVHTNYTTQQRTPKDSAYWYRDVIRDNGTTL